MPLPEDGQMSWADELNEFLGDAAEEIIVGATDARDEAIAAQEAAETARDEAAEIVGLPSEDAAIAYLMDQPTSATRAAITPRAPGGSDGLVMTKVGDDVAWAALPTVDTSVAAVRAIMNAEQTIAHSTDTRVTWGTVEYDTGGFWSSGTPTQFLIPASADPAIYAISATAEAKASASTTGTIGIALWVSRTSPTATERILDEDKKLAASFASLDFGLSVATAGVVLTAGDMVNVRIFATPGAGNTRVLRAYPSGFSNLGPFAFTMTRIAKVPADATTAYSRLAAEIAANAFTVTEP